MMPTYQFKNKETGEEYTEFMFISELESYLINNPHIEQAVCSPPIISGVSSLKPDAGFRALLSEIKKKNPTAKINDFGGG
jgi:hypothetical protein